MRQPPPPALLIRRWACVLTGSLVVLHSLSGEAAPIRPPPATSPPATASLSVTARSVTLDQKQGVATYEGTVELRQGPLTIQAHRAVLTRDAGRLRQAALEGAPITFEQRNVIPAQTVRGQAAQARYETGQERLTLTRGVILERAGDRLAGDSLVYVREPGKIQVEGHAQVNRASGERLTAPRLTYTISERHITAEGGVKLALNGDSIVGNRMDYALAARRLSMTGSVSGLSGTRRFQSEQLDYDLATEQLRLEGQVRIHQDGDEITCARLTLDKRNNRIEASGQGAAGGSPGRVRLILHPDTAK